MEAQHVRPLQKVLRHDLNMLRRKNIEVGEDSSVRISDLKKLRRFSSINWEKVVSCDRLIVEGSGVTARIRVPQGFSTEVPMEHTFQKIGDESLPPHLFHATTSEAFGGIASNGLKSGKMLGKRHGKEHIYLTTSADEAYEKCRDDSAVVIVILAKEASAAGAVFYATANQAIVTDKPIAPEFIYVHGDNLPDGNTVCKNRKCQGECGLISVNDGLQPLFELWKTEGCITIKGSHALTKLGAQHIEDIRHMASHSQEARDMDIETEWAAAQVASSSDISKAMKVWAQQRAGQSVAAVKPKPKPMPKAAKPRKPLRTSDEEAAARQAIAERLIAMASWIPVEDKERFINVLKGFEGRTLAATARSWTAWVEFAGEHGTWTPDRVAEFCALQKSMTGPRAVWHKLDLMRRHLDAPVIMSAVPKGPANDAPVAPEEQGVVMLPLMVRRLYHACRAVKDADWRKGAIYGCMLQARSTVRFAHLQRSTLCSMDGVSINAYCERGKRTTRRGREGFKFSVPLLGPADPLRSFWENWNQHKETNPGLRGLVIDTVSGVTMSMNTYHDALRELAIQEKLVDKDSASLLTSKSARMTNITMADVAAADWSDRCALGDWRESPGAAPNTARSIVPIRYQGARDQSALFVKLFYVVALERCINKGARTWDDVRAKWYADSGEELIKLYIANRMAEAADKKKAVGYCEGENRKQFIVPDHDGPQSQEEASDNSSEISSLGSDGSESDQDITINILSPLGTALTPFHLAEEDEPDVPLCGVKEFVRPMNRSSSLRAAVESGRFACRKCLRKSTDNVREYIAAREEL